MQLIFCCLLNCIRLLFQMRFGSKSVRRLAAATFLLRQILNLAVTVYTPTVALHAVLGLPHWASAAALTVVTVVFNLLGGLAAAIRLVYDIQSNSLFHIFYRIICEFQTRSIIRFTCV